VARENSSNDSDPSWLASSWSKIFRACVSSAVPAAAGAPVDVASFDAPLVGDGVVAVDAGGVVAVAGDMAFVVAGAVLAADDDVVLDGIAGVSAVATVVSDVVAHAAPATPITDAASAITTVVWAEFIMVPSVCRRSRAG
jgi:hypothetical protein